MRILAFDTSTLVASAAVVDDDKVLAEGKHAGSGRNADLLVTIDEVCRRANVSPMELDAVAIGAGPGSFTGLRIGMATAKGIAFAAKKPLWAVSSLAALAWDAMTSIDRTSNGDSVFVAVLDARRSEVFAGCYEGHMESEPEPEWRLLDEERVFAPSELAAWAKTIAGDRAIYFSGDAIDTYPELRSIGTWLDIKTPSGAAIAHLARTGERIDILTTGAPTYIRPSEAEVMYPDGVPGALRRP